VLKKALRDGRPAEPRMSISIGTSITRPHKRGRGTGPSFPPFFGFWINLFKKTTKGCRLGFRGFYFIQSASGQAGFFFATLYCVLKSLIIIDARILQNLISD
jgi:hypothetical protein